VLAKSASKEICAIVTYTKLIGTPNTLWLLGIDGRRLRKWATGEGGPKLRVRQSQAGSRSAWTLDCPVSSPGLMGSVGDRGSCRDDGIAGRQEKDGGENSNLV